MSRRRGAGAGRAPWQDQAALDQFDGLRVRLMEAKRDKGFSVLFSACHRGAGVSTVALHVAASLAARSSYRVILIDADLREPSLHRRLGGAREPGCAEVLAGTRSLEEVTHLLDPPGLHFVPAGREVEAPSRLFDPERVRALLEAARRSVDFIVLDGPPLLDGAEAQILAGQVDGSVLVLEAEETRWEVARIGKRAVAEARGHLLGAVLNKKKLHIPETLYRLL